MPAEPATVPTWLAALEALAGLADSPGASTRPSAARTGSPPVPVGPFPAATRAPATGATAETDRP